MFNFLKKKTVPPKQEIIVNKPLTQEKKEVKPVVQKPKTYFEKSVEAASKGNVLASAYVGVSYHYGIEVGEEKHPQGLEKNSELAVKYLTIAAKKGYLKSQIDLGLLYLDADSPAFDIDKALKWITLTAKKGDAFSQYVIGHYYNTGDFLAQDNTKAYHWLLESASNGCESAMVELGKLYKEKANKFLNHKDITDEHRRKAKECASLAVKWFEKAAELGEEEAFIHTGICYFEGYGTEKNEEKALYYLNLAIDSGDEAAIDFKNDHFSKENL